MRFLGITEILLLCMIAAQVVWLAGIWKSQATQRLDKVLRTGLLTLAASVVPWGMIWWATSPINPGGGDSTPELQTPGVIFVLCCLVLLASTFYARRQRVWPYDEEGNAYAARLLAERGVRPFLQAYADLPWLGKQHPPLIPVIGGFLLRLFGQHLLVLRLVSAVFLAGTILVTYLVGSLLYNTQIGLWGGLWLLTFPLVWRLGSAAMLDVPAMFWFTLSISLALWSNTAMEPVWPAVFGGIAVGLGLWTRYTVALIYPLLLILVFLGALTWPMLLVILLVSLLIIAPWFLLALRTGVLSRQLDHLVIYAGKKQGVAYPRKEYKGRLGQLGLTRSWRMRLRLETLVSRLPSAVGAYSLPLMGLFLLLIIGQFLAADAILLAWIIVPSGLLLILMPDHRYFLPVFPALAIGIARGLSGSHAWEIPPVVLGLLLCAINLYLYVDWQRQNYLFSTRGI